MVINGNLRFHTLGDSELQNAIMERFTTAARDALAGGDLVAGRLIYNSTTNWYNFYDGAVWQDFRNADVTSLQTEVNAVETASGGIFDTDGTFGSVAALASLNALTSFSGLTGADTLLKLFQDMDAAIAAAAGVDTLGELTDVAATVTSGGVLGDILYVSAAGTTWDNTGMAAEPTDGDLLQWTIGNTWAPVAPSTIGGNSFATVSGDSGSAVADTTSDTLTLSGATNGGITTIATDAPEVVTFSITPTDLVTGVATLALGDFIIVGDSLDAATVVGQKYTFTKMVQDLDIVNGISANGIIARTAADTYASRTIAASAVAGDQGISVVDGDGVAGNPTVGLDIVGLTAEAGALSGTDTVALYDGVNNVKASVTQLTAGIVASGIALGDLSDVDDPVAHTIGTAFLLVGDGTNLDVTELTGVAPANFVEAVTDIIGTSIVGGTNLTAVFSDAGDTTTLNVDDVFLLNTGDVLTAGTLTIATGASIAVATGGDLTIADAPVIGTDAANKDYVDSVATGLDAKDSVRVATTAALPAGTYANGTLGVGATFTATAVGVVTVDGQDLTAANSFAIGDRVLVKNQAAALQNGIYTITTLSAAAAALVLTRATDNNQISNLNGGNHTFAEIGAVNQDTGWVVSNEPVTIGTTDITWTQFTGAGSFTAIAGVAQAGSNIFMQIDSLSALGVAPASTDLMAFADLSEVSATTSNDRTRTIAEFIADFDLLTGDAGLNAITASDGTLVSGQDVQLAFSGLTNLATQGVDIMAFGDSSAAFASHIKRTVTEFISDHNILTGGTGGALTASDGVLINGSGDIQLDIVTLGAATIVGADQIAFEDASATGTHAKTTITNFLADLDIVNGITANGFTVRTAADVYTSRSIAVDGVGALDGLAVVNGDGVAGNPTLGLDIKNGVTLGTAEITDVTLPLGSTFATSGAGDYWTLSSPATDYYVWYSVGTSADPAPAGKTGITVVVLAADTAAQVATKTATAIDAVADFSAPAPGAAIVTVTNASPGAATDAADGVSSGATFAVTTQGVDAPTANEDLMVIYDKSGDANVVLTLSEFANSVAGVTTLGELSDVTANSATDTAGNVIVADGVDSYDSKTIQFNYDFTGVAKTTHVVNHNLGQKCVNVTVFDSSDNVIIPQSITLTDTNNVTVVFNSAIQAKVVVMGVPGVAITNVT